MNSSAVETKCLSSNDNIGASGDAIMIGETKLPSKGLILMPIESGASRVILFLAPLTRVLHGKPDYGLFP